jgi:nitrite reductase/ring-hydroxylating ferredoxin subunit
VSDWVTLGPVTRYPVGCAASARLGSLPVVVVRSAEDSWHVLEDACPHLGLGLVGGLVRHGRLACPHHAYTYDLDTGHRVLSGPVAAGDRAPTLDDSHTLELLPVRVVDGEVQARLG